MQSPLAALSALSALSSPAVTSPLSGNFQIQQMPYVLPLNLTSQALQTSTLPTTTNISSGTLISSTALPTTISSSNGGIATSTSQNMTFQLPTVASQFQLASNAYPGGAVYTAQVTVAPQNGDNGRSTPGNSQEKRDGSSTCSEGTENQENVDMTQETTPNDGIIDAPHAEQPQLIPVQLPHGLHLVDSKFLQIVLPQGMYPQHDLVRSSDGVTMTTPEGQVLIVASQGESTNQQTSQPIPVTSCSTSQGQVVMAITPGQQGATPQMIYQHVPFLAGQVPQSLSTSQAPVQVSSSVMSQQAMQGVPTQQVQAGQSSAQSDSSQPVIVSTQPSVDVRQLFHQDAQRRELEHRLNEAQKNTEIYRSQLEQAEKKAENYRDKFEEEVKERRKMEQLFQASRQLQLVAAYRQALNQHVTIPNNEQPLIMTTSSPTPVTMGTAGMIPITSSNVVSVAVPSMANMVPLRMTPASMAPVNLASTSTASVNAGNPVSIATTHSISSVNVQETERNIQPAVIAGCDFAESIPDQADFSSLNEDMLVTPTDVTLQQLHLPTDIQLAHHHKS